MASLDRLPHGEIGGAIRLTSDGKVVNARLLG